MSELEQDVHSPDLGEIVDLYQLDLTKLNGTIYYFTTSIEPGSGFLSFAGIVYNAVDIMVDGFEVSGRGSLPTPSFKIANISRALTGLVADYDDLVGAPVTRIQTLSKYLDDGDTPNPSAHFPPDVFVIAQKVVQDKLLLEFQLQAAIDVEGQKIPNRLVLRNYCKRAYRIWNPNNGAFDYSKAQCPYAGAGYFDRNGEPTTPDKDQCGKDRTGCMARYGDSPLPTWAFFGVGQFGA